MDNNKILILSHFELVELSDGPYYPLSLSIIELKLQNHQIYQKQTEAKKYLKCPTPYVYTNMVSPSNFYTGFQYFV